MPPRASIVNLAPGWKRKGRKGNLDVTKFIQRRAIGRRQMEWKGRSMFARGQDNLRTPEPNYEYETGSDREDDVFNEMKRNRRSQKERNRDSEVSPAKGEMFRFSWKPDPSRTGGHTTGVHLDTSQHVVEENDETSIDTSPEPKELPRLPISRGSMFGKFTS